MIKKETVRIEKLVHGGFGLGRLANGKAIFVPLTIPDEEVQVDILEEKSSHAWGKLNQIVTASPWRRQPACPFFGRCGGCQLMHLSYQQQVLWKSRILEEMWRGRQPVVIGSINGPEYYYRYRISYQILPGNTGLGFMATHSRDLVAIDDCLLCTNGIRHLFPWLREKLLPKLSEMEIEAEKVTIIIGDQPPPILQIIFRTTIPRQVERKILEWSEYPLDIGHHRPTTQLGIGKFHYHVDAGSFFQANPMVVADVFHCPTADFPIGTSVVELYSGMGLFTVFLADNARQVIAVESAPRARTLFEQTMHTNGIRNATLAPACVETWLRDNSQTLGGFTGLFLDPPRTGLSKAARQSLSTSDFHYIRYLSCDIATQFRDVQLWLKRGYHVDALTLFDFFPNTYHQECLAAISRNS